MLGPPFPDTGFFLSAGPPSVTTNLVLLAFQMESAALAFRKKECTYQCLRMLANFSQSFAEATLPTSLNPPFYI